MNKDVSSSLALFENENEFQQTTREMRKGLREFRIYRAAPSDSLLAPTRTKTDRIFDDIFGNNCLFFTTQKNMAMEYAVRNGGKRTNQQIFSDDFGKIETNLLFEMKGIDFLSELQAIEKQNYTIKLILFSHQDLATYERLLQLQEGDIASNKVQARNFISKRTRKSSDVSPELLRKAAEIIVVLDDDINELRFKQGRYKLQKITNRTIEYNYYNPGRFHQQVRNLYEGKGNYDQKRVRQRRKLKSELAKVNSQLGILFLKVHNREEELDKLELEQFNTDSFLGNVRDKLQKARIRAIPEYALKRRRKIMTNEEKETILKLERRKSEIILGLQQLR